nr:MAG TPA: hypothetical protein [Caudoviricetes sp.]
MARIRVSKQNQPVTTIPTESVILLPWVTATERLGDDMAEISSHISGAVEDILGKSSSIEEHILGYGDLRQMLKSDAEARKHIETLSRAIVCECISRYLNLKTENNRDKPNVGVDFVSGVVSSCVDGRLGMLHPDVARQISEATRDDSFSRIVLNKILSTIEYEQRLSSGWYNFRNKKALIMCYNISAKDVCFAPEDIGGDLPSDATDLSLCVDSALTSLILSLRIIKDSFDRFKSIDELRAHIYKQLSIQSFFKENEQMRNFVLEEVISKDIDFALNNLVEDKDKFLNQLRKRQVADALYSPRQKDCSLGFNFEVAIDISGAQPKVDVSGEFVRDINLEIRKRRYEALKSFYSRGGGDYSLHIPMGGGTILEIKNPIGVVNSDVFSKPFARFPRYKCEVEALENPTGKMTIQCEVETTYEN